MQEPELAIYNTDAEQKMRFHTERRGTQYPVAIIFSPNALKDEAILEYERSRDQRLTDADVSEGDDSTAIVITNQSYRAALQFAEKHSTGAEGYAGKPSDKDRAFAVQNLLLGAEFEELPVAAADELCPADDDDNSTYHLRCLSPEGALMATKHVMRAATSGEISEAQLLQSRTLLVQGVNFGQRDQRIPSKAKRWAELYDLMKVSAEGYAGKVPLHHKVQVAMRHLKSEQKAITGN